MTKNPFLDIDRSLLGDIYSSREAMENLTILCDEYGSRFGGTSGERQAAEFIAAKMSEYGMQNVHLESFDYIGWQRGKAKLEIIEPVQMEIPCITLPHSPPADLEADIVDLGEGAPDSFTRQAAAIKGNIVMTSSEVNPDGVRRWVHRGEKYGRSLLAGAAGFIFVNHYPGYGPATGGIGQGGNTSGEAMIPGISLSKENGAFLQRLLQRHGRVRLRMTSSDQSRPTTSWNVIGELPGHDPESDLVMLGCHYDGHDISQGAEDPASGIAAMLEAGRTLAKYANMPCTVRFIAWGVEEIGLIGSKQYVAQHADELDGIRFYLNLDAAGSIPADKKGIMLNEWPALAPLFEQWAEEMALPFKVRQSVNAHSDHYPFLLAGVPTGGMGNLEQGGGRGYGHTHHDTLDKVKIINLREAAALSARLVLRLAHVANWPVQRRDQETVRALLDAPENREQAELFAQVQALYAAQR